VKTLGEVCEVNQGDSLTKTKMIDGIYDVIGGGKIIGKHNEKNRDGNDFTLTRVGDININYIDKPYYLTDNAFSLKSNKEKIITKYIYYLLSHNKDYLINLYQGTAQKVISKTNLKLLKIPIPSLERQKEIIEYCEFNDTLIKQLEKEIENNKRFAQKFITGIVKTHVNNIEEDQYIENIDSYENIDSESNDEINSIEEDIINEDIINEDIINEDVIEEPNPIIKKILIKIKKN
jgi:restriction endonuclease S subunit